MLFERVHILNQPKCCHLSVPTNISILNLIFFSVRKIMEFSCFFLVCMWGWRKKPPFLSGARLVTLNFRSDMLSEGWGCTKISKFLIKFDYKSFFLFCFKMPKVFLFFFFFWVFEAAGGSDEKHVPAEYSLFHTQKKVYLNNWFFKKLFPSNI